jgi:hypothetical protein
MIACADISHVIHERYKYAVGARSHDFSGYTIPRQRFDSFVLVSRNCHGAWSLRYRYRAESG